MKDAFTLLRPVTSPLALRLSESYRGQSLAWHSVCPYCWDTIPFHARGCGNRGNTEALFNFSRNRWDGFHSRWIVLFLLKRVPVSPPSFRTFYCVPFWKVIAVLGMWCGFPLWLWFVFLWSIIWSKIQCSEWAFSGQETVKQSVGIAKSQVLGLTTQPW